MAKQTAQLGEINTGHISPIAPVRSEGFGPLLETVGNLAVTGIKIGSTTALKQDAEALQQQYVSEQTADLTPEELAETTEFGTRIKRLQNAAKQTGRTAEFRTRAEALLKERINTFPGLASHYRQAVSGVLGFDPTGETARQVEEQLKIQQKTALQELDEIEKDMVNNYQFVAGDISKPEKQEQYLALKAIEQKNLALAQKVRQNDLAKQLNSDARHIASVEEATANVNAQRAPINTIIKGFLRKNVPSITEEDIKFGITPEVYTKAEPQVWEALIRQLESQKAAFVAQQASLYSSLNPAAVADIRTLAATPYDEAIAALSGKKSLEVYEQQAKMEQQKALGKVKDSEYYEKLQVTTAMGFTNLPIQDIFMIQLFGGKKNLLSVVDSAQTEASPKEIASTTPEEVKGLTDYFRKAAEAIQDMDDPQVNLDQISNAFYKLSEGMANGNASGEISKDVANAWLDVIANKDNKALIDQVGQANPFLKQTVDSYMFSYMSNLTASSKNEVASILGKYRGKQIESVNKGRTMVGKKFTDIPFIKPVIDARGVLTFEIDEAAIRKHDSSLLTTRTTGGGGSLGLPSKTVLSPFMKDMERLKNSLAVDLNKVVKATANLDGISEKEAAQLILQDLLPLGETTTSTEML